MAELAAVSGADSGDSDAEEDFGLFEPLASDESAVGGTSALQTYSIAFRPQTEMLQRANEPLHLVRQLQELGDLTVVADFSALPELQDLEPTDAYLAWTFKLESAAGLSTVQEVFEFVEDDCDLSISRAGSAEAKTEEVTAVESGESPANAVATSGPTASDANSAEKVSAISTIRVELDRVDRLGNMVGEIIIAQAAVSQQIDQELLDFKPRLVEGLLQLLQHTQSLQDNVMAIRAQPVRSIFARMPRLVRDLSQQTGKIVRLEMSGEGTEIDKTVIEQLSDPLTHLIRNAVDHGIEDGECRRAAGKPEEGNIHLSAEQRGNRIVIGISDDGGGINRERVQSIAVEKGLIAADAVLSDEEADSLILLPGFSTAETVSNISGRGVGMDVVNQNIRKLGGRVTISSVPGRGTTLALTLPLTLAVLDGMTVRVGRESYIIPLTNIVESLLLQNCSPELLPGIGQVLRVRREYVKLIDLQNLLMPEAVEEPSDKLVILVELDDGGMAGLVVDEILGQQQVVLKNLEENFQPVPGIAGATILGDGDVALILDVTAIKDLHESQAVFSGIPASPLVELEEKVA